jgi:hypothetical protein
MQMKAGLYLASVLMLVAAFSYSTETEDSLDRTSGGGSSFESADAIRDTAREQVHRQAEARTRRENLTALGSRIKSPSQIDSMRGLSDEDRAFLRRRYQILHPLD